MLGGNGALGGKNTSGAASGGARLGERVILMAVALGDRVGYFFGGFVAVR